MTTSVKRPCFATQHQTRKTKTKTKTKTTACKARTKTKTDFSGLRPVLSQVSEHVSDTARVKNGSQQTTKVPVMTASVLAAFLSRRLRARLSRYRRISSGSLPGGGALRDNTSRKYSLSQTTNAVRFTYEEITLKSH